MLILTCKFIAGVIPGILGVDLTGWGAVSLQVLLQVPAFGFIKCVEKQGKLLDVSLGVLIGLEGTRLTDHKWTNQTRVKVLLLGYKKIITNTVEVFTEYHFLIGVILVFWKKNGYRVKTNKQI